MYMETPHNPIEKVRPILLANFLPPKHPLTPFKRIFVTNVDNIDSRIVWIKVNDWENKAAMAITNNIF